MRRLNNNPTTVLITFFALFLTLAPQAHAARSKARTSRKKAAPKSQVQVPPLPPPTPEQLPAVPPQVAYQNGLLTIVAPNSTMAAVLNAVHQKTGATIELPPGGGNERVVGRMGPGPARDVLATLLDGSRFNYVMVGSDSNPSGVERVILTSKISAEAEASASPSPEQRQVSDMSARVPVQPSLPPNPQVGNVGEANVNPEEEEPPPQVPPEEPQTTDEQGNPLPPGQQFVPPEDRDAQVPLPPGYPNNPNQQVKTPEQLLLELQRMQQQQQQQQQQQEQNPQ